MELQRSIARSGCAMSNLDCTKDTNDPRLGTRLGKYQITGVLGRGGMGVVYEATDTLLKRPVAIKLLPEKTAADPAAVNRFQREGSIAGKLSHPNVVAVYEVAEQDGVHYLVMERIAGETTAALLEKQGPFAWLDATWTIAEACRGLIAAHAAGLIHRDIKPSNIMRSRDGQVKLMDFGLAKLLDRNDPRLTSSGYVVGTPTYMSPEQCQADPVDVRSDVYSLGTTFYELLAGKPPFLGSSAMHTMYLHCHEQVPDLRAAGEEIPERCARIVHHALAKEPEQRYQTATELLADLELVLVGKPTSALSAPERDLLVRAAKSKPVEPPLPADVAPAMGRSWKAVVVALAAVGLIAVGIFFFLRS
jgi:serine/threonine protein kinase